MAIRALENWMIPRAVWNDLWAREIAGKLPLRPHQELLAEIEQAEAARLAFYQARIKPYVGKDGHVKPNTMINAHNVTEHNQMAEKVRRLRVEANLSYSIACGTWTAVYGPGASEAGIDPELFRAELRTWADLHEGEVREAHAEGKPVPYYVLRDYGLADN